MGTHGADRSAAVGGNLLLLVDSQVVENVLEGIVLGGCHDGGRGMVLPVALPVVVVVVVTEPAVYKCGT